MSYIANLALIPHQENLKKSTETLAKYAVRLASEGETKKLTRLKTWAISAIEDCGFPSGQQVDLNWYCSFLVQRFDEMKKSFPTSLGV
jgi:hypothetical protein